MATTRHGLRSARRTLQKVTSKESRRESTRQSKHVSGSSQAKSLAVERKSSERDAVPQEPQRKKQRPQNSQLTAEIWKDKRCDWSTYVGTSSLDAYLKYHDEEWGVPCGWPQPNDDKLFEMISLEGAQVHFHWYLITRLKTEFNNS